MSKYIPQFRIVLLLIFNYSKPILAQFDVLSKPDSIKIASYFDQVNDFMDKDNYDSTQYWLDKIEKLLPIKYNTYFSYLFHSRQTEIYYYNNLHELGINQIKEGLKVAIALKDSTLIGDSYNFLGLFYLNLKQFEMAKSHLLIAKKYIKWPSKVANIYNLSQLYHVYGNLGEVYEFQNQLLLATTAIDSSIFYSKLANRNRATYLGIYKKGDIQYHLKNYKKGFSIIQTAQNLCENDEDNINTRDIYLVCFGALAKCMNQLNHKKESYQYLSEGFDFYKRQKDINRFYSLIFMNDAIEIYTNHKDFERLQNTLKLKMALENENIKGGLKKLETTINASLRNERRIMNYQISEAKLLEEKALNSQRNYTIILILVFSLLGFIVLYNRNLRKSNKLLIQKNTEISEALLKGQTTERKRVAIDLHDNLGSTISSIKYSLEAIDRSKMNEEEVAVQENLYSLLDKAYNDVRLLSHNLLPEEFDKQGLSETLKTLVRKMNKNSKINYVLHVDEPFGRVDNKIEFELYSICLELITNIQKHSQATEAKISLGQAPPMGAGWPIGKQVKLTVSDNGIGIFKNDSDGKGMKNVQARVDSISGTWSVKSTEGEGVVNEILV